MALLNNLLTTLGKIFKKKKFVRKKRNKKKTRKVPSRRAKTSRSSASGRKKTKAKKIPKKRKTVKSTSKPKKRAGVKKKRIISLKRKPVQEQGILVGEITHYFSKIKVCVVKVTRGSIRMGDQIRIKGSTSDFAQKVKSLQIESRDVRMAKKGQLAGLKVDQLVRSGDKVYNSCP